MIDIGKFARPFGPGGDGKTFGGGLDDQAMIAGLRDFADRIERGEITVGKVQAGQIADVSDWYQQALYIEFTEASPVAQIDIRLGDAERSAGPVTVRCP